MGIYGYVFVCVLWDDWTDCWCTWLRICGYNDFLEEARALLRSPQPALSGKERGERTRTESYRLKLSYFRSSGLELREWRVGRKHL